MSPRRPRMVATLLAAIAVSFAALLLAALSLAAPAGAAAAPTQTPPTLSTSPSPPGPPIDVHVAAVSSRSITIAWTAPAPTTVSVAGYDITWNQAFNDVFHLQSIGDVTSFTLDAGWGVQPTGQYSFRVVTKDALGHPSTTAGQITVVTPASDTAADQVPPAAVTGLQISGTTLTWAATTDNMAVTGYDVYRFDGLYNSTLLATAPGTTYTVTPTTTTPSIYYVRARDAAGNLGIASNIVTGSGTGTTTPPPPVPTCRVAFRTTSQWQGGFVSEVTVSNTAAAPVNGWVLNFRFGGDQKLTNAWNATFTQSGADVTLTAAPWNRTIPAAGTVTAGVIGSWTSSAAAPTGATLNGAPCTLA